MNIELPGMIICQHASRTHFCGNSFDNAVNLELCDVEELYLALLSMQILG